MTTHAITTYSIGDYHSWRCACGVEQPGDGQLFIKSGDAWSQGVLLHALPAEARERQQVQQLHFARAAQPALTFLKCHARTASEIAREYVGKAQRATTREGVDGKSVWYRLSRWHRRQAKLQRRAVRELLGAIR